MKRDDPVQAGRPPLDLIDEAIHLLRIAPVSVLAGYYIGALPFVLGLLYFFADMSRGAFAGRHIASGSLGLALLFWWMKTWHAIFARNLRAVHADEPLPSWNLARIGRIAAVQGIIQPTGLFIRPLALLFTFPYGWVRAFYHNATACDEGEGADLKTIISGVWDQAKLWPRQNHLILGALSLFGLFTWLNVIGLIALIPFLAKSFFGFESMFTRSGMAMYLNTTFIAASFAGVYLCLNPITTTVYVLRCFYGKSLRTGDDLKIALKTFTGSATQIAAAFLIGFFVVATPLKVRAEPPPSTSATAPQLNQSVEEVLNRPEFSWRMPREKGQEAQKGMIEGFFESIGKALLKAVGWLAMALGKFFEWIFSHRGERDPHFSNFTGWEKFMMLLGTAGSFLTRPPVLLALALVLSCIIWWWWKKRSKRQPVVAQAIPTMPDLASEDLTANQLPEDGWLTLAREMMDKGDLRLALRAFYLAGLAHLGARELISIAKYKSNLDYERELRRRARTNENLLAAFDENVGVFEWAWYGWHEVTTERIAQFAANLERIKTC